MDTTLSLSKDWPVQENLLYIKNPEELIKALNFFSLARMCQLKYIKPPANFNLDFLRSLHKYIFGDVFEWAGKILNHSKSDAAEKIINETNEINWINLTLHDVAQKITDLIFGLSAVKVFDVGSYQTIMAYTLTLCKAQEIVIDREYIESKAIEIEKELAIESAICKARVYDIIKEAMIIGFAKENTYEKVAINIEDAGYEPTETLVSLIMRVNNTRLKMHTVMEIYDLYKYPELIGKMEKKYIYDIAEGFRYQERIYNSPKYTYKDPEYDLEIEK